MQIIDPNITGIIALMVTAVQRQMSIVGITQALIVAGITASATGYVSARVLEREVGYLRETIERVDREQRAVAAKVAAVELRQAAAIAERLENQKQQQEAIDDLRRRIK